MRKIKVAPFMPTEVEVNEISENRAQITAYPFESGYAVTLAHPLRRLILGSSIGYAPISVKIEGAAHEFDNIRGMHEDVAVFIINLKNIRFKIKDESDRVEVSYSFAGHKEVTAQDLNNDLVEVVNGDLPLATLNEDAELNFTVVISKGIGYVPSENLRDEVANDAIALDAFFTPVRKANYAIEPVLVEDNPSFEKIIFDIVTDAQIGPVEAFTNALEVMNKQLSIFNGVLDVDISTAPIKKSSDESELKPFLQTVDSLGLSARSFNSLDRAGIKYLGELVLMSENEIKNIKNLGKKSLDEINECLVEHGFGEDYDLSDVTRAHLVKKLEQLKQ
ncbi:DNA-directed RNA polymerase subunit alpha [Sulfurovum sp.]|jgi:DNA-directed RNA polymerase subunit alpha|uniref:DNA-directed RNA polymerase subunit alpha n=1 Tax=Sulfurovum sp. TaxID=1969726 RepID=UPI002A36601F|nr:DNA-directed RNA polymerase subunit alpha [Sulfurovum sp.]MDD2450360.1 DNA-directed RNA polymerase subunit alpha [Sulfurovum sp.]MDD3498802.1 DNA-directed RNA polymerase subunit alpha [Sulfurovum sp.]MDY0403265.1 DNA-directed RNA polymerase subunit alpha [Sulfurovum sp.]